MLLATTITLTAYSIPVEMCVASEASAPDWYIQEPDADGNTPASRSHSFSALIWRSIYPTYIEQRHSQEQSTSFPYGAPQEQY